MKIYVGGLAFQTTEEELKAAFEPFGQVLSVNIVKDPATGQSRGFGFVEMGDTHAGLEAIKKMNGAELGGRTLKVDQAKERASGGFGFSRGGGGGGGGYGGGGYGGGGGRRRF